MVITVMVDPRVRNLIGDMEGIIVMVDPNFHDLQLDKGTNYTQPQVYKGHTNLGRLVVTLRAL